MTVLADKLHRTVLVGLCLGVLSTTPLQAQNLQSSFADIIREAQNGAKLLPKQNVELPAVPLPPVELPTASANVAAQNNVASDEQNSAGEAEKSPGEAVQTERIAEPTLPSNFVPSYGKVEFSLMFPEAEMSNMRKILRFYEVKKASEEDPASNPTVQDGNGQYDDYLAQVLGEIDGVQGGVLQPEEDLTPLPSYYLGTILYRSPTAWSFWLNGRRINPGDEIPEILLDRITPTSVSMLWQPERLSRVLNIWDSKKSPDAPRAYGNRSASKQHINVDVDSGFVTFTLSRHQTFNAEVMEVYEGKLEGGMDPFTYVAPEPETQSAENEEGSAAVIERIDPDRALMNDLLENTRRIQEMSVPESRRPGGASTPSEEQ